MTPAIEPTSRPERIISLDVLRGFALLGILVMNIQSFSMIGAAYFNPTAYGDLSGANYWVWLLSHVLTDQKFMTIFSMLFGAGIFLMTGRAESRGKPSAGPHYRRMGLLILFGLLHAHLLWWGDILYAYGMCGLVVYLLRKLSPQRLLLVGFLSLAVSSSIWMFFGWSMEFWPPEALQEFRQDWRPGPETVTEEIAVYQSSWLDQMGHRVPAAFKMETFIFLIWSAWRAGGLMLVGMALFKLGWFSAQRSSKLYASILIAAVMIGIPIIMAGVHLNFKTGWDVTYSFFFGWQYNYWASILVSLGWVSLVMLVCKTPSLSAATRPFAAVGQMAFTNYIMQTIICTTIFYGHGFGLFGQVNRVGQIQIVVAIWIVQLIYSPIWLRYFRFGPLEWLWRSLTYWKWQLMKRGELLAAPTGG